MSYAVVKTGGKQHRVQEGDTLRVEKLAGAVGSQLELAEVLFIGGEESPKIGRPVVPGAKVQAKIVAQGRGKKIRAFKRRRRQGFHKTIGHRQCYTELEIMAIEG